MTFFWVIVFTAARNILTLQKECWYPIFTRAIVCCKTIWTNFGWHAHLKLPPQLETFSHFLISASVLGVCHLKITTCCLRTFLKIKKENNYYISCYSTYSTVSVTELARKTFLGLNRANLVWVIDSLLQLFHLF